MARRTSKDTPSEPESTAIQPSYRTATTTSNEVSHGLSQPSFDVNSFLPSNLFTVSSSVPETEKSEADKAVSSIEKQRHTMRIASANIGLARDVVKVGTEYVRLKGDTIDYATALQENITKTVKYQTARVNTQIAENKLAETQERLTQSGIQLQGVQSLTPLIQQEWGKRIELQKSKVEDIRLSVVSANNKIEASIQKLESSFESANL